MNMNEIFQRDTVDHKLVVRLDKSEYKHFVYAKPGSSCYSVHLIFAPGTMIVRGDMGAYVFEREYDMLEWVHGCDPDYVASKCASASAKKYDHDKTIEHILWRLNRDIEEDLDPEIQAKARNIINDLKSRFEQYTTSYEDLITETENVLDMIDGNPEVRDLISSVMESDEPSYSIPYHMHWSILAALRAVALYKELK